MLDDDELARILTAARQINGPYAGIVELLALTGQRREEVAQLTWEETRPCQPKLDATGLSHEERQATHGAPLEAGYRCADAHAEAG